MPGKAVKRETIRKNTIDSMKKLGTYKAEYDPVIDIYSEMREQYELYTKRLANADFECEEFTAAGGTKKSALITTIETLRKDILQYSDRLCLNPKAMQTEKGDGKKKKSQLSEALKSLG